MKYIPPLNDTLEREGKYVTANPIAGVRGSTVPAEAIEHPMREIVNCIEQAGLTPNDADLTQLQQVLDKYLKIQDADFAPSGYGIGDYNGALIPNDDLDYAVKGGLYCVSGNTLNKPTGTSSYSVCVVLSREYTTNVIQLYVDRNHKLFIRNSTSAVPAGEPVSWDLWKQVDAGSISGKTLVDLVQKSELNAPGDAPYFVCRAWVHFNGADNLPTIHSQGNISSVTKQVTGIYTINFLNPMVDAHYVCSVASGGFMHAILEGATANSVSVSVKLANGADGDSVRTQIAIFR